MERAARAPGAVVRDQGDLESDMARAARRLEAEYYIPHLTHASMEPLSATARITGGRCELWAPTQAPQAARERVAQRLGMPMDHVSLNVTLLGGGFGRKSKADFIIEAALLSKAMDGAPVKVTWTREDDVRHSYYHTASLERLEAGLDAGGRPLAWRHSSVAPTIGSTFGPDPKHQQPFELGMGLVNVPFDIPSIRIENPEAEAHTRIGWYRSVSNIPHAFAIQSFVDELAAAAGRDPKDYLLELIGPPRRIDPRTLNDTWNHSESPQRYPLDTGRLRGVVEAVARASGWGAKLPAGQGLGIAAHYSFLTYVAVVMRASVSDAGALSIPRVDIAVDCGPQINPDRIRSQMEGACIMGLSNALLSRSPFSAAGWSNRTFTTTASRVSAMRPATSGYTW
jgi:isoquinoline 1-oxidoreductase beta subunit